MSVFIKINNENYFIDFLSIENLLSLGNPGFEGGMIEETTTTTNFNSRGEKESEVIINENRYRSKEVDSFKYETIRNMISVILDTEAGSENDYSIGFKLSFNTLVEYGILNIAE